MEKIYYVCSRMVEYSEVYSPENNYEKMFTLPTFLFFPKIKIPFVIVVEDETKGAYEFFTKTAFEMHDNRSDHGGFIWSRSFTLPDSLLQMSTFGSGNNVFQISEMQPSEVLKLVNPFIEKQKYFNYATKVMEDFFYIFRSRWERMQEAEKRKKMIMTLRLQNCVTF